MQHIIGSAVEIFCEIPSDKVSGTEITLESLIGPDDTELAISQTLAAGATANLFSVVWQSVVGSNPVGKYKYIIKAKNGLIENFGKGYFYLIEQDS